MAHEEERNRVFQKNSVSDVLVDAVETLFKGEKGRNDNNLQFVRAMLLVRVQDKAGVLRVYKKILREKEVVDDEQSFNKTHLKLSGIVRREKTVLKLSNRIYQDVFNAAWIKEQLPFMEKRTAIAISGTAFVMLIFFFIAQQVITQIKRLRYPPTEPVWVSVPAGKFVIGTDIYPQACENSTGNDTSDINQLAVSQAWCMAAQTFNVDFRDSGPSHYVFLDTFEIMMYEVANEDYSQCVKAGACESSGYQEYDEQGGVIYSRLDDIEYRNHPVVNITWYQAVSYCSFIGARLPTEAEWEKAARGAGGLASPWPWNKNAIDCSYANINQNNIILTDLEDTSQYFFGGATRNWDLCVGETMPVGSYEKGRSPYGLYDMAGNVWEWTADWYKEDYYKSSPLSNPLGPKDGNLKILRGGSWYDGINSATVTYRFGEFPATSRDTIGFRCARSVDN